MPQKQNNNTMCQAQRQVNPCLINEIYSQKNLLFRQNKVKRQSGKHLRHIWNEISL